MVTYSVWYLQRKRDFFLNFSEIKDGVHQNEVKHERKKWEAPSATVDIESKLPNDLERYG